MGFSSVQDIVFWRDVRLSPSGATTSWDATFGLLYAANRVVGDRAAELFA